VGRYPSACPALLSNVFPIFLKAATQSGRCHCRSHEDSRRLSSRPGDGFRPQPLRHYAGGRAGSHSGGRPARRWQAAELIDLTRHQGAHPRMGATDVIPFIPIDGVTMEDCVAMAAVGAEIWKRFQIPVYLYEAAAQLPNARILRIFAAASLREFATRLPPTKRASPTSASRACIPRPEPRGGRAQVPRGLHVFLNTPDVAIAKRSPKPCASPPAACATSRQQDSCARHGPGLHEPDRLRADSSAPRLRVRETRSRALRLRSGLQRDRRN